MIEFQSVSKKYSDSANTLALADVSLNIAKGELVYLAGPSGAGKSTLMKMVAAIERPTSGRVIVNGQDVGRIRKAGIPFLRRNLGLIFQNQRLLNDRHLLANVMLPLIVTGAPRAQAEQRARAALDKVGLADRALALPMELSGGEQQRVAIARAIVNEPDLLLADEPTGALDSRTSDEILHLLMQLHKQGRTIVVVTHSMEVAGCAQRRITIHDGKIVGDTRLTGMQRTEQSRIAS